MNKDIAVKQHVLEMLKEFLMGEEGSKFKPKSIEVEMMGKPHIEKMPMCEPEMDEMPMEDDEDDEDEEDKPKMSLKDFLSKQ